MHGQWGRPVIQTNNQAGNAQINAEPAVDFVIFYLYNKSRCGKRRLIESFVDAWLSLVERCVRDAEAAGSNPVASIFVYNVITDR